MESDIKYPLILLLLYGYFLKNMRSTHFFPLLLSFSILKGIEGQNYQAESFLKEQLVWHNQAATRPANRNTDYILYTLATLNTKPLNELRIYYDFSTHVFVPQSNGSYADVRLSINDFVVRGDISYRGFELSKQLVPDQVKASFVLSMGGGHTASQLVEFSLQQTDWPMTVSLIENMGLEGANIRLQINQLGFTDEAVSAFSEKVTEVNNYWASLNLMDSLMNRIQKRDIANDDNAEELLIHWDLCRKANIISKKLAEQTTSKEVNGRLTEAYDKLVRMQTRLSTLLERSFEKEPNKLENPSDFAKRFVDAMYKQKRLSMLVPFQDADAFYRSGRLLPDNIFGEMLSRYDDKFHNNKALQLIYASLIAQGDSLQLADDLAHAYDYYEDAMQLGKMLPQITPEPELPQKMLQVQQGLLSAYFRIAASAIEKGNNALAAEYQQKANTFVQQKFSNSQPVNSLNKVFETLSRSYIKQVENALANRQHEDAISLLDELTQQANNFQISNFNQELSQYYLLAHRGIYLAKVSSANSYFQSGQMQQASTEIGKAILYRQQNMSYLAQSTEAVDLEKRIREPVVGELIQRGIQAYQAGNNDEALGSFLHAREQARAYELKFGHNLDSLSSLAAKPIILDHIKSTHLMIWANKLEEAWDIYENAAMLQSRFLLSNDPDIKAAFDDLDRRLIDRICLNHQLAYKELMQQSERLNQAKAFDKLQPLVSEAIDLYKNNPGCGIDPSEAEAYTQNFSQYFDYQQRYDEVLTLLFQEGLAEAVEAYLQLDADVMSYNLARFGQQHTSLDEYIMNQRNNAVTMIALEKLIELEEAEKAFDYLVFLQLNGYSDRLARTVQEQTAEILARQDIENGRGAVDRLSGRALDSRWFRSFDKAYSDAVQTLTKLSRKN
jgi:hypothetical protein